MRLFLFIVLIVGLISCQETEEKCAFVPETDSIHVDLQFQSLEDSLPAIRTKQDLVRFMTNNAGARDLFFNRPNYPGDSTFINRLYNRFTSPYIDTLLMETHRVFGTGESLEKEFHQAYRNLKYYYPNYSPPVINTLISGLETDLYATDSVIFIGLDYFLGPGAKYRPNNMYEYMLRRYNPGFIVPSVILLTGIADRFNKINPDDKTVLAEMIAYGKAFYFTKRVLPCTPDSVLMGYTRGELAGSLKFENLIWSRLVQDEVLFSTSHMMKQKYIAERPKTIEVGEDCPGRIAQWIGWRIVERYMESHPDVTLPQLMDTSDAAALFRESGYKPQVVKVPSREKT